MSVNRSLLRSPYRFFLAAAALAALMCMFPVYVDAPVQSAVHRQEGEADETDAGERTGLAAGADLSERTQSHAYLHRTTTYAPCGHSVQRREKLPAQLVGLTRAALESALPGVIPGAAVTGFSQDEVDIALSADIPCPLHWVLRTGENGMLQVLQNRNGEALSVVRETDVGAACAGEQETAALLEGKIFDDVQALEGYLESISS